MLRQKWGSVVCPSCKNLVGVNDEQCLTCGRWNPGLWGYAPFLNRLGRDLGFTKLMMGTCITLYALMLAVDPQGIYLQPSFGFLAPSERMSFLFGASGFVPAVYYGRWWTVLTAGWLHGSLIHIFFNLMWIRDLAPATSEIYGASRMIIIYIVGGVTGFIFSTLSAFLRLLPLPMAVGNIGTTVGASAPLFGLLAALIYYGRRGGSTMISNQAKSWALMLFIFGFIVPSVDNFAHAGGFVGGYIASKFLDPLRPERLDHMIVALLCLAATGVALVFSIVTGLKFINA